MTFHRGSAQFSASIASLVAPALVVPALVSVLVVFVPAPAASPGDTADDPRAVDLLRQSATAAQRISYTGTQYVSTWSALTKSASSTSAIVQVRHQAGGPTEVSLHDDQTAILEGRTATSWLAGDGPAELLLAAYTVRMAGTGRVAGRDTEIVEARRADGSVAARLWLDEETSLSLRRESFAQRGYPLSASAFVDVTIGNADLCCGLGLRDASSALDTSDSALHWSDIEQLRADGWYCPGELTDGMMLYEARRVGEAIQLSYSDGVMTVSVFAQKGRLDPDRLEGYTRAWFGDGVVYMRPGPPARLMWSTGDQVITVVAEAPVETVDPLIDSLPPQAPPQADEEPDGFLDRIGRGAQRVASWMNPFD